MKHDRELKGAGGGGGKRPKIVSDNLRSTDLVEAVFGLGEGPIVGLYDGPRSIYFDETPVISPGGQENFTDVTMTLYSGVDESTPVKLNLGGTSSSLAVGVELSKDIPVIRTTNSALRNKIDRLEVRIIVTQLFRTNNKGAVLDSTAEFDIDYRKAGSVTWLPFRVSNPVKITGKTTSTYVKEFSRVVPRYDGDWEIRVTKRSPDNDPQNTVNLSWESVQQVDTTPPNYPDTALLHLTAKASDQFSRIPRVLGDYRGLLCRVPVNYTPLTRYYDESVMWDGASWKLAFTDNPAWCLYHMLTDERIGVKRYYPGLVVDPWDFYDAAKWCDELVPRQDGVTFQPRYTFNEVISDPRGGIDQLRYVASIFGGLLYDDFSGTVRLVLDSVVNPTQVFGPESVGAEGFQYTFSDTATRANDITVSFINPNLNWAIDRRRVFDQEAIDRHGRIPMDFVAIGCLDPHEATRRAHLRLLAAQRETTTVQFQTARAGMMSQLFDVILIADPDMGWSQSGRVGLKTETHVFVRDKLFLPSMVEYTMKLQTVSGIVELTVRNPLLSDSTDQLEIVSGTWPADVPSFAQFTIVGNDAQTGLAKPFRILRIEEADDSAEVYTITAMEVNVNKYTDSDLVISTPTVDYSFRQTQYPLKPINLKALSGDQYYRVSADGNVVPIVLLSWEQDNRSFSNYFVVNWRLAEGGDWNSKVVEGNSTVIEEVINGETYDFEVIAVNFIGNKSIPAELSHLVGQMNVSGSHIHESLAAIESKYFLPATLSVSAYRDASLSLSSIFTCHRRDSEPLHSSKIRTLDRFRADGVLDEVNGGWWEVFQTSANINFQTRTELMGSTVLGAGTIILGVRTFGYSVPGDNGAGTYRATSGNIEPTHPGKVLASGIWWELVVPEGVPEMFGAAGDGVTDDTAALLACRDYCIAKKVPMRLASALGYAFSAPILLDASAVFFAMLGNGSERPNLIALSETARIEVGRIGSVVLNGINYEGRHPITQEIIGQNFVVALERGGEETGITAATALTLYNCTTQRSRGPAIRALRDTTELKVFGGRYRRAGRVDETGVAETRFPDGPVPLVELHGNGFFQDVELSGAAGYCLEIAGGPEDAFGIFEEVHARCVNCRFQSGFLGIIRIRDWLGTGTREDAVLAGAISYRRPQLTWTGGYMENAGTVQDNITSGGSAVVQTWRDDVVCVLAEGEVNVRLDGPVKIQSRRARATLRARYGAIIQADLRATMEIFQQLGDVDDIRVPFDVDTESEVQLDGWPDMHGNRTYSVLDDPLTGQGPQERIASNGRTQLALVSPSLAGKGIITPASPPLLTLVDGLSTDTIMDLPAYGGGTHGAVSGSGTGSTMPAPVLDAHELGGPALRVTGQTSVAASTNILHGLTVPAEWVGRVLVAEARCVYKQLGANLDNVRLQIEVFDPAAIAPATVDDPRTYRGDTEQPVSNNLITHPTLDKVFPVYGSPVGLDIPAPGTGNRTPVYVAKAFFQPQAAGTLAVRFRPRGGTYDTAYECDYIIHIYPAGDQRPVTEPGIPMSRWPDIMTAIDDAIAAIPPSPGDGLGLSHVDALTATGSNQGDAAALTAASYHRVTGATGATGVRLPAPTASVYAPVVVRNNEVNQSLLVYPHSGGQFDFMSANAPMLVPPLGTIWFYPRTTTIWHPMAEIKPVVPVRSTLATTGTVDLDMQALNDTFQQIAATGNLTFTQTQRRVGRRLTLRIAAGASSRTLAWPAAWVVFGAALPTSLDANKVLLVEMICRGTAEADVDVEWKLSA